MRNQPEYCLSVLINCIYSILTTTLLLVISEGKVYSFNTVTYEKNYTPNTILPSKIDLTKLPPGKTFKVLNPKFSLKFFFNNQDIFGFILSRKRNFGIIVHLCFFRSCEESAYDTNQVILMPQDSLSDKKFFSIKFPHELHYEFQGIEFKSIN